MAMTPESRVKEKVKAYLRGKNAYFFMPVQTGYGAATVDFLCCVDGRFIAIETKAPGKKPTKRQRATLLAIIAAGGNAFVVTLDEKGNLIWSDP
jgi:hypothetical protein